MKVRRHFFFSGEVQGVGFRYSAFHLAEALGLTGWVRNLWDGRVEMEAQGDEAAVERLASSLDGRRWIRIDGVERRDMPLQEEERRFRII